MRDLITAAVHNVYKDLTRSLARPDRHRPIASTTVYAHSEYPNLHSLNVISAQLSSMSIGIINTIPNSPKAAPDSTFEPVSVLVQNRECPICFEDLMNADRKQCRKCKQIFHESCIKTWLQTGKASCPLCRYCQDTTLNEAPIILRMPYFPMPSSSQPPVPYIPHDVLRHLRSL